MVNANYVSAIGARGIVIEKIGRPGEPNQYNAIVEGGNGDGQVLALTYAREGGPPYELRRRVNSMGAPEDAMDIGTESEIGNANERLKKELIDHVRLTGLRVTDDTCEE